MRNVRDNRTRIGARATRMAPTALAELDDGVIPVSAKGVPPALVGMTLRHLRHSGIPALGGEVPMPMALIKESVLESNIAAMQQFCDTNGVLLSPHGKTTLAPALFARQLAAGAWAITAATPAHLRMYRHYGVERIMYANQLVEPVAIRWLAAELNNNPGFEFFSLVDSVAAVHILDRVLATSGLSRAVKVLVEVGYRGGRCGVRDSSTALEVAAAVDTSNMLQLTGIECFEGLVPGADTNIAVIDDFLQSVTGIADNLIAGTSLREAGQVLVSAGGSAYFDRVVATFRRHTFAAPIQVVLRSGCYITQDGGFYSITSPLQGRATEPPALSNALEVWSVILSRPEPGLVITSMGRRDCSYDLGLPIPHSLVVDGAAPQKLAGAAVYALSDQHAHVTVPDDFPGQVGDLLGCRVSHPCTTFDKWGVLPIVDDSYRIVDAIATAF